ncbi:MAG: N-acetylmuramoyl-L-alanine amidase, partial [Ignavibacteriales bacterium]|nr:N-acetylmuramoyl-L-alanine amidase [Ignavibacteriales bacterium]
MKVFRASYIGILILGLFFPCLSASTDTVSIALKVERQSAKLLRGLDRSDVVYLALNDLLSTLSLPSSVNAEVRKLEFRIASHRVKITADNPFLVITDLTTNAASVYQMPVGTVLDNDVYFVPAEEFLKALTVVWPNEIRFDPVDLILSVSSAPAASLFDITNVAIERKLNGYLMTVEASRKLSDVEAWLKPDGWLFVTVANAKADTNSLANVRPYGAIRKILVFQSPTSVQLTFKVAPDVVKAEVLSESGTNNLLIALHTQSAAEKAELERLRQQMNKERLEKQQQQWKLDVIVLDPGHGGKDPGTIGVRGTKEKDITLGVAQRLGQLLEKNMKDVKVVYTRKSDQFVELYKRTQIANDAGGKLFISIHCNSMPRKPSNKKGFEIYLLRPGRTQDAIEIAERENSVIRQEEGFEQRYKELTEEYFILVTMQQSAFMKYSEQFAEVAARSMGKHLEIRNGGVKQAGFYVLVGASMPNVLVETGYLSNREEEAVLKTAKGQREIAQALFEGIKEYKAIYEKALREGTTVSGTE